MKRPSQKMLMCWALFVLFAYVCAFRDSIIVGIVAPVFTITISWLFRLRITEKRDEQSQKGDNTPKTGI
jgi:hypothetical protein